MPTYVYKFLDTGETIEVQQSFDDPTLTEFAHPVTGATLAVKKVFLPVGVTFKGEGFYKTDSRSSKKPASTGSSESSTATSESKSASTSDSSGASSSKPAATTASTSASGD